MDLNDEHAFQTSHLNDLVTEKGVDALPPGLCVTSALLANI